MGNQNREPVKFDLMYTVQFNFSYPGIVQLIDHDWQNKSMRREDLLCPWGWDVRQTCDLPGNCWVLFESPEPLDPAVLADMQRKIDLLDAAAWAMCHG